MSLHLGMADGGLGNDTVSVVTGSGIGGIGDDVLLVSQIGWADGGDGNDVETYSNTTKAHGTYAAGGGGEDPIILGRGAHSLVADVQITPLAFVDIAGLDLGAGNDGLRAEVAGTTYLLGEGNDTANAYAANVTFWGGTGMDSFSVFAAGANIQGEAGNDYVSLIAQALVDTGNSHDQITLSDTTADLTGSVILTGNGDDLIWAYRPGGSIDFGAGNDRVNVYLNAAFTGTNKGGAGSDTFMFPKAGPSTITGLNVAQDHLGLIGVARVSDLDSIGAEASSLRITEGALTMYLTGLQLGDLTDAVFVAAVYHG